MPAPHKLKGGAAKDITESVREALREHGLELSKCVALGADGASVMSGGTGHDRGMTAPRPRHGHEPQAQSRKHTHTRVRARTTAISGGLHGDHAVSEPAVISGRARAAAA